ncbi:membrane protein [Gordonia phage Niagara]|uniref:Uncharacterized protein n=2 Tax=Demosthenesvirus katyusha TaxID=1982108 RepID=A0A345MCC4_9CAUD|nr:hypothetical protein SEA_TEATEALATTE_88 [Gordonia phage Teatealatte]QBP29643.1 hypothetical protein SEA_TREDGE_87 [Gordonia phage Tredge]UJD20722.1 membrane protein [Gordonia phage Niagara]
MKHKYRRHYAHTTWIARGIKILCLVLLGWVLCAAWTDPVVETHTEEVKVPIVVPDPYTIKVTETVERKPSKECGYLIRAVNQLTEATDALSATKADLTWMVKEIKGAIGTQDPNTGVALRRDFWKVENEMNNAYIDIGTAQTHIERYKGACD